MENSTIEAPLPPEQDFARSIAIALPSGLSIIAIMAVYCTYNSVFRHFGELYLYSKILYRMVVYMATANLFLTIAGIGIFYDIPHRVCNPYWVFLREASFTSSIIWSSYYAYSLKEIITGYESVSIKELEKQGFLVAFAMPLIATGALILLGYQEGLSILCYTLAESPTPGTKYVGLFAFAVPVSIAFCFSVYCYVKILQFVWLRTQWNSDFQRILREIVLFPTAIILCSFFLVLNTILVMFFNKRYPTLILIHHILQQSAGFTNALVYGFKYASYNYFKEQFRSVRRTIQSFCSSNQTNEKHSVWEPNHFRHYPSTQTDYSPM